MVDDPRFIPGIYNYCDRWCERCSLTSRCLVFARNQAEGEADDFEEVVRRMQEDFADVMAMLQEKADEIGIDLSQAPDASDASEAQALKETMKAHPLRQAAEKYAEMAGAWLAAHARDEDDRHERPASSAFANELRPDKRAQMAREGAGPFLTTPEAITIIGWHRYQIAAKLTRALSSDPSGSEEGADHPVQTDANGSAKIALLAIERSLDAWFELLHFNHDTPAVMRILEHLNALRDDVDRVFPDARRFVRPGFDTGDRPWSEGEAC